MSRKLNFVPYIPNYNWIKDQMREDLKYRLSERTFKTSLGTPLYYNINIQMIITQECPFHCPFCLERQNPMTGNNNFSAQLESLKKVLIEHPSARLSITGGEPSLYLCHIDNIVKTYHDNSENKFISINTAGYNKILNPYATINLSYNDYVKPNLNDFLGTTYQTVLADSEMTLHNIIKQMREINQKTQNKINDFSFRFLTEFGKENYNINIFNEIQDCEDFEVKTFRVGDFFVYLTFNYQGNKGRITLGDMTVQQSNDYKDGYSNIIIHPDGIINTNWR